MDTMLELGREHRLDSRPTGGRSGVLSAWVLAIPLACTLVTATQAQIRTDGTLGGPAVALVGPNFLINEALGRLAGSNLFHSFQVFDVGSAESATFVTTTPALANVISRVTGGTASQINGLVKLDAANAAPNFFFINPAGVVFGNGAKIDVPAGFHVSTANYLKFPDGNFYADPKAVSTLSSAAPEAFGFLGTTRAAITVKDGAALQTPSAGTDQPISIVAGDVEIDGGGVTTAGGDIRVTAVGPSPQEVALSGPLPDAHGNLDIRAGGYLLSAPGGATHAGDIVVAAGNVLIDGAGTELTGVASVAVEPASGNAGNVTVNAAATLTIVNGAGILADTFSAGRGGAIKVTAGRMVISGSSAISSSAREGSTGDAGTVDVVVVGTLAIGDGGVIQSNTETSGGAGRVTVTARDIGIDGGGTGHLTGITSRATAGTGDAGRVDVTATRQLSIANGGTIQSDTFSAGNAGTIKVVTGDLVIDGQASAGLTGISSSAGGGTGNGGAIEVAATGGIKLVRGAEILSNTISAGDAGAVNVTAGTLTIDGTGALPTGIFSTSTGAGSGDAGGIAVTTTGVLSVANRGFIAAGTASSGRGGAVKVTA